MVDKRVAIVTGGTRGMGKSISLTLAAQGDIVVAVYRADDNAAYETEQELKKLSERSIIKKVDLADGEAIKKLVAEVDEEFGRIDILVNNAGIAEFRFLEEYDEEAFDHIFNVNFRSQLRLMYAVVPAMKRNAFGRIVNASSVSGTYADVGQLSYGVSKAAINMLTRIAAGELGSYGITVNAYAPGIIYTDMTKELLDARGDFYLNNIPARFFGAGDDVAALVQYLVSDGARYINGDIIGIGGGLFKVQNPYRAYEYIKEEKES